MNARNNRPITRSELVAVRQQVAAQRMRAASADSAGGQKIAELEDAIDGGVDQYPLPTTDQSLAGAISELYAMILAGGSGGLGLSTIEVNLGNHARRSGRFVVAGSGMTVGKPVVMQQAVGPYTGKGSRADEAEMDHVSVAARVTSASEITGYWRASGPVRGNFKFDMQVSG